LRHPEPFKRDRGAVAMERDISEEGEALGMLPIFPDFDDLSHLDDAAESSEEIEEESGDDSGSSETSDEDEDEAEKMDEGEDMPLEDSDVQIEWSAHLPPISMPVDMKSGSEDEMHLSGNEEELEIAPDFS
jgi:hypothetical protein